MRWPVLSFLLADFFFFVPNIDSELEKRLPEQLAISLEKIAIVSPLHVFVGRFRPNHPGYNKARDHSLDPRDGGMVNNLRHMSRPNSTIFPVTKGTLDYWECVTEAFVWSNREIFDIFDGCRFWQRGNAVRRSR